MSIDFNMIRSEVENLARELNRHRDNDLSHNDKITVSDLLAETVTMIRKKYGITTMYYVISEAKALEGIGYAEPFESRTGQWEISRCLCAGSAPSQGFRLLSVSC